MSEVDPAEMFSAMMGNSSEKITVALLADKQLDILLKYMQILWYADQLEDEKMLDQLTRKLKPMIELLCDNVDKAVTDYQNKYGEI